MVNEFKELSSFLSRFLSYDINKITKEKSLDDFKIYGDDKKEFLEAFFKKFKIQHTTIDYEKYCELEIFNPFNFFFKKAKNQEIKKITLSHLIEVMKNEKWFDPIN